LAKLGRKPIIPINREVTIEDFIEYNECPNKYVLSSIHGKPPTSNAAFQESQWIKEKANKAVNDFAIHFFFHKMYTSKTLPTTKRLKYWEKIWLQDQDILSIATNPFSVTYDNILNINTNIVRGILNIEEYFDMYDVVTINERAFVVSKHNYVSFPIPLLLRNKITEEKSIWMFSYMNYVKNLASAKNNILYKGTSAAFEHTYGEVLPVKVFLLGADKDVVKEYEYIPKENNLVDVVFCLENIYNKEVSYSSKCFSCGHRRIKGRCDKDAT
jgi:hypothetical protein